MTNDSNIQIPAFSEESAEAEESAEPIGQIAPTLPQYRGDWRASSGLSKKNIPNRRGVRLDIPDWSVRSSVSFHTKA